MKEFDKIYNELSEYYTDKEIADAFIFPGKLTEEELELTEFIKKKTKQTNGYS